MLAGPVTVIVPGERESLRVLRLVASDVGRILGFGYDTIEDSRLAVNEAASLLLAGASGDIECRIGAAGDAMTVEIVTQPPIAPWPPLDWEGSLGHLVLSHVVDRLDLESASTISFTLPATG